MFPILPNLNEVFQLPKLIEAAGIHPNWNEAVFICSNLNKALPLRSNLKKANCDLPKVDLVSWNSSNVSIYGNISNFTQI